MSGGSGQGPDLSRIVSLIMQNPDLIKQIEALARQDESQNEQEETDALRAEATLEIPTKATETVASAIPMSIQKHEKRAQLLTALRPYVSEKRGKTLETLIGMVDLFDLMGRG